MKYLDNIQEVAQLQPDYLGFIFYEKSARNNLDVVPTLSDAIQKIGVFVDASIDFIVEKVSKHQLQGVQLHGSESTEYCQKLKSELNSLGINIKIIKVFSVKNQFDFSVLATYEMVVDYFLFDTKGALPGGNGYTFNWEILEDYPSEKPFILSGGIGIEHLEKIKNIPASLPIHAIDINSKFEIEPGLKNIELLKEFITKYKDERLRK
ncbi:phosphoribosylanthranilate isomerase [Joostella sp. CR20]|uniref:phosphoribosylanthranilate isomerase n=1 Tax=Joostella sp. CR20 TaxID=2804312 RepID=UPI00313B20C8